MLDWMETDKYSSQRLKVYTYWLLRKASHRLASVIAYGPQLQVYVGTFKVINALKKLNKVTLLVTCCYIPAFIRRKKSWLYIRTIDTPTKHSRTSQL